METREIANKLVHHCREGKNVDFINEFYGDNIISKEPKGSHRELTEGKEAVKNKTIEWYSSVQEVHDVEISEPIVAGNFFSCGMHMDVTYKEYGRMAMDEICVFEVKDGKIIAEEFFYNIPG